MIKPFTCARRSLMESSALSGFCPLRYTRRSSTTVSFNCVCKR